MCSDLKVNMVAKHQYVEYGSKQISLHLVAWHLVGCVTCVAQLGPCTYRHFNFLSQIGNEEWKMGTHFPFLANVNSCSRSL